MKYFVKQDFSGRHSQQYLRSNCRFSADFTGTFLCLNKLLKK